MITDNPASRLLAILTVGKGLNSDARARDAWIRIFELETKDPYIQSILMSKLGKTMLLPYETKILVEQYYPSQTAALIHTLDQINKAFAAQSLNDKWSNFISHIDTHCISTLSMAAALLEQRLNTTLIEKEKLDSFSDRVQELINETINSNLSAEFKRFMTHYLQKILSAINDYLISGAMPILDAVQTTLGHAVLDPKFKDELKGSDTGNKISEVLGDLANVVTVVTAATGAAAYLAANVFPMLG